MPQGVRLGRIEYLNVLPVQHGLESGKVAHDFVVTTGTPAALNEHMAAGELDISAISSVEYARRPERYLLVPDLAIGSKGPVGSVLLLSRVPVAELGGQTILVSSQTHTSSALLRLLLADRYKIQATLETADVLPHVRRDIHEPTAVLAIGDEALGLRDHPDYPHRLDLGEAWREWTGLPFVFGLWAVRRDFAQAEPGRTTEACTALLASKAWGVTHLDFEAHAAAWDGPLDEQEMRDYFKGLVFDLGPEEQAGLNRFFTLLAEHGDIPAAPELEFFQDAGA